MANPSRLLEGLFKRAGVYRKGKLLHALRHTAATELLSGGADLETVRAILGHRHVTTTALYLHASADRMREAVERAEQADLGYTPAPAEGGKETELGAALVPFLVPREHGEDERVVRSSANARNL